MKKKVIFVITKSNWGGAQRYIYDLATSLPPEEFDRKILFGRCSAPSSLEARIKKIAREQDITFDYIENFQRDINIVKEIRSFAHVYAVFKTDRPDIVHLNSSKAGGLGALAARLAGVPKIIFTAHGWPFYEDRVWIERFLIKIASWATVILCHTTITLHERDEHSFDQWPFTKGKLIRIHNGIRQSKVRPHAEAREFLAQKYNVPKNAPLIGTIGELHQNKGFGYLLEAFVGLPDNALLCIVGEGEKREELKAQAKSLGIEKRVYFTGFIPSDDCIKAFDIFVLSSVKEGLPYVILEAGLQQVPIVATAVGGVPDLVRTGITGLLVEPKQSSELTQAIKLLLKNREAATSYASSLADLIKREFEFETVTLPQTIALYRS